MNKNGTLWMDTDGHSIQAHGGMILEYKGTFYWYGENKNGPTSLAENGITRVDFIGISCYSSTDLIHWKNEGIVLPASPLKGHDLHKDMVCERPRVLYHKKNREFVMWIHVDRSDYTYACAGIAVSDSPTGPFNYLGSLRPNGYDSRDLTLFQEEDGSAYLIYSSDWNRTLRVAPLTDDYKNLTGLCTKILTDQKREAPAIFKHQGLYYMISSGCTGWNPNPALYAISQHILSEWLLIDNPLSGPNSRITFGGQGTCVFKKDHTYYLVIDHWNPDTLKESGYSILPITVDKNYMEIPWQETPFSLL